MHDLELDILRVNPEEILGWYDGPGAWGIDPVIRPFDDGTGTEVTWLDDADPMEQGETRQHMAEVDAASSSTEQLMAKVEELGGSVVVEKTEVPGMGWYAAVNDSEGSEIGLWESLPG